MWITLYLLLYILYYKVVILCKVCVKLGFSFTSWHQADHWAITLLLQPAALLFSLLHWGWMGENGGNRSLHIMGKWSSSWPPPPWLAWFSGGLLFLPLFVSWSSALHWGSCLVPWPAGRSAPLSTMLTPAFPYVPQCLIMLRFVYLGLEPGFRILEDCTKWFSIRNFGIRHWDDNSSRGLLLFTIHSIKTITSIIKIRLLIVPIQNERMQLHKEMRPCAVLCFHTDICNLMEEIMWTMKQETMQENIQMTD